MKWKQFWTDFKRKSEKERNEGLRGNQHARRVFCFGDCCCCCWNGEDLISFISWGKETVTRKSSLQGWRSRIQSQCESDLRRGIRGVEGRLVWEPLESEGPSLCAGGAKGEGGAGVCVCVCVCVCVGGWGSTEGLKCSSGMKVLCSSCENLTPFCSDSQFSFFLLGPQNH